MKDDDTSILMAALGVAIGVGCVAAAYLDSPARRPLFVPAGASGLAAGFGLLGFAPTRARHARGTAVRARFRRPAAWPT